MGVFLEKFISENDIIAAEDFTLGNKKSVYDQAARHMVRDHKSDILSKKRPFETQEFQDYREENRRNLSYEGILDFQKMLIKVLQKTSLTISEIPPILQEHLDNKPYKFHNTDIELNAWMHRVLIPYSILDPNAITVELPVNPDNIFVSPTELPEDGGLDPALPLTIKTKIIYYNLWKIVKDKSTNKDYLLITIEDGYPLKIGNSIKWTNYYFAADDTDWYIMLPSNTNKGIEYNLEYWYPHDYGNLPFSAVPGISSINEHKKYFQISFCQSYFDWADEFLSRFQDDQVIHTRYAYPREVMANIPCETCSGTGKIPDTRMSGGVSECHTCKGTGNFSSSISGRIIRPSNYLNTDTKEAIAFVNPDVGIISHSTPNALIFLDEARKTLGLDVLNPAQEAEETKKIREQVKIEKLIAYSHALIAWKEKHLNQKLSLLSTEKQDDIIIQLPLSIAVKSEETLKQEIKDSLPIDRIMTINKYVQEKYSQDKIKQRIHFLAAKFAPLIYMSPDEIRLRLDLQAYNPLDLIKADKAIEILTELSTQLSEQEFMLDDKSVLEKAENLFSKEFIVSS